MRYVYRLETQNANGEWSDVWGLFTTEEEAYAYAARFMKYPESRAYRIMPEWLRADHAP